MAGRSRRKWIERESSLSRGSADETFGGGQFRVAWGLGAPPFRLGQFPPHSSAYLLRVIMTHVHDPATHWFDCNLHSACWKVDERKTKLMCLDVCRQAGDHVSPTNSQVSHPMPLPKFYCRPPSSSAASTYQLQCCSLVGPLSSKGVYDSIMTPYHHDTPHRSQVL